MAELGLGGLDPDVVLSFGDDLGAAGGDGLGPPEGEAPIYESPEVQAAVEVELVVVDALVHGLGPVGLPHLDPGVFPSGEGRVGELVREVLFEGDGVGLSHPDQDNALPLGGWVDAGAHLVDQGGLGALDEAGDALTRLVESVAVVGTGDGPFELAEAPGESGAAVGAPFVEGNYFAVLAPEQDEFLPEHLDVLGLASHFLDPNAGVPVLTEP